MSRRNRMGTNELHGQVRNRMGIKQRGKIEQHGQGRIAGTKDMGRERNTPRRIEQLAQDRTASARSNGMDGAGMAGIKDMSRNERHGQDTPRSKTKDLARIEQRKEAP